MRLTRNISKSRQANAAMEFALIAPILTLAGLGTFDAAMAYITLNRLTNAARTITEIATGLAVTAAQTNTMSAAQAVTATAAIYAYLPELAGGSPPAFGVTLSSVVMTPSATPCGVGCTYSAHVAWSGVFQGAGLLRPCDAVLGVSAMTSAPDSNDPSPTTLPASMFAASPTLVADVTYRFQPLFFIGVKTAFTMNGSAYFTTRVGGSADWVKFADTMVPSVRCPGYPAP